MKDWEKIEVHHWHLESVDKVKFCLILPTEVG